MSLLDKSGEGPQRLDCSTHNAQDVRPIATEIGRRGLGLAAVVSAIAVVLLFGNAGKIVRGARSRHCAD